MAALIASRVGMHVIPGLPREDAAKLWELSADDRGDVAVVSLRGELDFLGASVLQACLSGIRWRARARSVVDLAGLAFLDCACLGVLVRHCKEVRSRGGSFALAGPQPAVRLVLSATGLLTWFEVHDTFGEAVADASARRSGPACAPSARSHGTAVVTARDLYQESR